MKLVLYQPQIPPNTGTIARLCAATMTALHLIEPLGFSIDDKHLKRAGLDYWKHVDIAVWKDWEAFLAAVSPVRLIMTSARNGVSYQDFAFQAEDSIVLGPETQGLPARLLADAAHLVRIPIWGSVRSLNLSNAASILLYEAYRQTGVLVGR
jgi:tRNA (cytidine/uridine-2'-O-)-methyltransferase